jgi:hypothetical protein
MIVYLLHGSTSIRTGSILSHLPAKSLRLNGVATLCLISLAFRRDPLIFLVGAVIAAHVPLSSVMLL